VNKQVSLLITDLDNTLFDWVNIWYRSFSAMFEVLLRQSGISRETLEREMREVFQREGTSEYAFVIEQLPSLRDNHSPTDDLTEIYSEAIDAYRSARDETLVLYPTVLETLWAVKDQGSRIVGYTESMEFYTNYRMRHLGLDGVIDYLYSPPDHDLPLGKSLEEIRKYPSESYELKSTIQRHTPKGVTKPSPEVLKQIVSDMGIGVEAVVYVGDSLMKDIAMARDAGVSNALAEYGAAHQREEYELLRRVTHWSDKDVAKEKQVLASKEVEPDTRLRRSFCELLAKYEFVPFGQSTSSEDKEKERADRSLEAWKTTVTVQQHFNDIEMSVRNFALTLLVAIIAASALAIREKSLVSIFGFETSLAVWLLVGGIIAWLAFYFVDQIWYHRLLVGAVTQGRKLEELLERDVPGIGLTTAIGDASPYEFLGEKFRKRFRIRRRFTLHSKHKMQVFYFGIALMLFAFAVAAHFNARGLISASGSTTTTSTTSTVPTTSTASTPPP
jgi:phosphoglycolate phosphatase-like HAD superfamily hydrolase